MIVRWLAFFALGACNWVYDLEATRLRDGMPPADAALLVTPPDGTTSCPPPPDFETWTYAPVTGFAPGVERVTFLRADRLIVARMGALFEATLDGHETKLAELDLGDGAMLRSPAAATGHAIFWFMRFQFNAGGPYYATHDGTRWTQHRADLPNAAYQIQPGGVGAFGGSLRMVFAEQKTTADKLQVVELSSPDGEHWERLATTPWSDGSAIDFDPTLSPDGCMLVFRRIGPPTKLYVAHRQGAAFAAPIVLTAATGMSSVIGSPAFDPTGTQLWFVRDNAIVAGHP